MAKEIVLIGALLVVLTTILLSYIYAAYQIRRPIADTGGKINQYYLYGEVSGTNTHKENDYPYPNGTSINTVADGTVVQLKENLEDGNESADWGNFVLMRHTERHYDRTTQQLGYVYSNYLHLKYVCQCRDRGMNLPETGRFSV